MGLPYGQPLARAPHILFLLQNVIIKQDFLFFVRILENPLCKQIYKKGQNSRKFSNFVYSTLIPLSFERKSSKTKKEMEWQQTLFVALLSPSRLEGISVIFRVLTLLVLQ